MTRSETAVVGAGLAGLSCARRLTEGGVKCNVFEAADRVGGRVTTDRVDGWQLLRIDRIARALPRITSATGTGVREVTPNVTMCGDHLLTPSIEGAILAGRNAAEAVLK